MADFVTLQVIVTVKKSSKEPQALKELMHREAGSVIRNHLTEYLRCLKEGSSVLSLGPEGNE